MTKMPLRTDRAAAAANGADKSKPNGVKKRILIVDDHPVLRQGIAQLIEWEADLTVCGQAGDAHDGLMLTEQLDPDLAIVDISLKDSSGIDLIKDMVIRKPRLPILVVSMHNEAFYAERVFRAGAKGYVTKGEPCEKVIEAIRRILNGEVYVSETIAGKMVGKLVGGRQNADGCSIDRLSDREFEVFEFIGQGMQTREIAENLHLSVKTIDAHRENIKGKLNLKDAAELLKTAIQWVQFEQGN